jgi:hypothetical protein
MRHSTVWRVHVCVEFSPKLLPDLLVDAYICEDLVNGPLSPPGCVLGCAGKVAGQAKKAHQHRQYWYPATSW